MGDGWRFSSTHSPTPSTPLIWTIPTSIPFEVDDRAPIPLIVGIALALFIGFIIIVCCICRRRTLTSSPSSQNADPSYQRAPTTDGALTGGGFGGGGMGGGSYPMTAVNHSAYVPPTSQAIGGMHSHTASGGITLGQHQPPAQHPYPSLPPNAYTPPYPIGYAPLPSYMPQSQSSHASSASGPSSDHGPSGFSSSSPPAPAPAPTGMMASSNEQGNTGGFGTLTRPQGTGMDYVGGQGQAVGQATTHGLGMAQTGIPGSGLGPPGMGVPVSGVGHMGFQGQVQGSGMAQYGGMAGGAIGNQGTNFGPQGAGTGQEGEGGTYTPLMHPTAMDYKPGGGFIPRITSPLPAGMETTSTELGHL